jgi:hypothetical protein
MQPSKHMHYTLNHISMLGWAKDKSSGMIANKGFGTPNLAFEV